MLIEKNVQVIIPMAGKGSRFTEAGYETSKPMLPIGQFPMFLAVLANIYDERLLSVTIIKQSDVNLEVDLNSLFKNLGVKLNIVELDGFTDGAATTVEYGLHDLHPDLPVVIVNSDQYVSGELTSFYDSISSNNYSGVILTMNDIDPKWSYIRVNEFGSVTEVVEKEVISDLATVGIYGFASAKLCSSAISQMKKAQFKVNGEFYLAPAYNFMPEHSSPIHHINLGPVGNVMYGLGTPVDYQNFLVSSKFPEALNRTIDIFGGPS
jgi:NDP-sugar pyrophosphorylase family protein